MVGWIVDAKIDALFPNSVELAHFDDDRHEARIDVHIEDVERKLAKRHQHPHGRGVRLHECDLPERLLDVVVMTCPVA